MTVSGLTNKGKISVSGTGTQSGVESGEPGGQHIAGVCSYYQIANAADNWKNEGEIHCSVNCSTTGSYVAGVLGRVSIANTNLSNFTNSGNIYIDEGYKFGYCGIGGVVALVKNVSVFDGLQNNGEIIANESIKSQTISHARIGGIIGHIESVSSTTVKNSINNGAINIVNGNSTTGCAIGGVVGNAKATTFTGTNNVNTGNVTYDGTNTSGSLQIGGVYGRIETNNANTTVSIEGVTGTDSNSGIITLNDTTGCSKTPAAGGVIGSIYGYKSADSKTIYKMTLTLNNCKNTGKIYRKVSNYTYESATYTDQYAGGIVGNASTQIGGTISNCINTAEIRFSKDSGGKSAFTTATQIKGYIGGIGGRVGADNYITIQNCHNSGNIPSIEGFCGGIVGYGWSISILGEKGNYCTNTGDIAHREGAEIASLQSTAGGILGGGSTKVTLEWCYNTGTVAGDKGGCAGIVGRVNNKTAAMTVKYCKTFCKINSSSDWARSGFIFGYTSAQEDATELLKNVKYVAVGGQYRYGGEYSTPTSENYVNHLYYNKTTASDAAQKSSAATATITVEKAAEYEITLWDGTSEISWEK